MAVEVAQGSPGSGKSAVAVSRAIRHLKKGGVVAANFSLVDGWAEDVAKRSPIAFLLHFLRIFIGVHHYDNYVYKRASCLHKRLYRVDSLASIRKIFPVSESVDIYLDNGKYSEGSGLLLLDEAQLIFNSRKWEKNFDWIQFFTQHRKLGWNVILIAHDIQMIDSQIRPLAEYESRFRNLQKVKMPFLGVPLSPFPLFLVITRYAGLGAGAGSLYARGLFPLPLWAAQLYDSLLVFSADQWGKDTDPHHCGPPPLAPRAEGGGVVYAPRYSKLEGPHWDNYLQTIPGQNVTGQGGIECLVN